MIDYDNAYVLCHNLARICIIVSGVGFGFFSIRYMRHLLDGDFFAAIAFGMATALSILSGAISC